MNQCEWGNWCVLLLIDICKSFNLKIAEQVIGFYSFVKIPIVSQS